jgi:hypothetical protein
VRSRGIKLVIFPYTTLPSDANIRETWRKVATLSLVKRPVFVWPNEEIYATNSDSAKELQPELRAFRESLPPGAKLTIYDPSLKNTGEDDLDK